MRTQRTGRQASERAAPARTVYAEVPPRTEYSLTPLGGSLIEPFLAVRAWAKTHAVEIHRHRTAHDRAASTEHSNRAR
nr:winged helix-turn-helix transcriptional regulator [Kitasatospora purpeofusca]